MLIWRMTENCEKMYVVDISIFAYEKHAAIPEIVHQRDGILFNFERQRIFFQLEEYNSIV